MRYHERQRLFREHAAARLQRESTETARIEALLGPDLSPHHHLFVFALFAAAVTERFGDEFDRAELADFTTGLRQARPDLHWRRAEALIRLCYGESSLYLEVPTSEQPALMWAVLARLVPPDAGDDALAALFDRADAFGRRVVSGVFETQGLYGWADEDDPDGDEPPAVGEEPR